MEVVVAPLKFRRLPAWAFTVRLALRARVPRPTAVKLPPLSVMVEADDTVTALPRLSGSGVYREVKGIGCAVPPAGV